jgi:DNA-binding transcriptional LysR family regulator
MKPFSLDFTIDLRRLRVLRELRERGTVSATAEALNLTPSAVSQQIANLSRETGIPLLTPQGRGVRLTAQANLLLEHAAIVDAQMERARADLAAFHEGQVGHVTIGAFATAVTCLVAPALTKLRTTHPRLDVGVLEVEAPDCFTRLDAGDLDLVIAVDYPGGPLRQDPRYSRQDLLHDPFQMALPAQHRLAARHSLEMRDLAEETWILGGSTLGPCQAASLAACTGAGFTPNVRYRTSDWTATFALVAAGCGVALIPRLALSSVLPEGIVLKPLTGGQRPSRHLYTAIRAGAEALPSLVPVLEALQSVARTYAPEAAAG